MSVSLLLPDITAAIASIVISGVTIKDYDGIAANWQSTARVLYPNPEGFITDFAPEYFTLMRGASAPMDAVYTLNYRYLDTAIGDLANLPYSYGQMIDKVMVIVAKLLETDTPYSGRVEMELKAIQSVGAKADPAGNMYHGADIALLIREMQNV